MSSFRVDGPFGLSEEKSLGAVEGTLNVGVFGITFLTGVENK